jgi:hypothetical protein
LAAHMDPRDAEGRAGGGDVRRHIAPRLSSRFLRTGRRNAFSGGLRGSDGLASATR